MSFFQGSGTGSGTSLPQLQLNLLSDQGPDADKPGSTGWDQLISRSRIQTSGKKTDVLWAISSPGKHRGDFTECSGVIPALPIKRLPEEF